MEDVDIIRIDRYESIRCPESKGAPKLTDMTKESTTPFAQRYRSALKLHLAGPSRHQATSRAARSLGREASETGIGVLDVVSTHDQAMAEIGALAVTDGTTPGARNGLSPGGVFLIESLSSIEERNLRVREDACEALRRSDQRLLEESERNDDLRTKSRSHKVRSRKLAHLILLAQEEERREISRELHDEVAQILAGINVRLAALREVGSINFQSLEKGIQQTQELIEESVNVVHRFARKLRPAILDDLGLIPALRSFIKDLPRPDNLEVHIDSVPEVETMDSVRRTVLYRVIQEALLNVVRHAEAHLATVNLTEISQGIRLEVRDDGKAFQVDEVLLSKDFNRLGILGMRERVEMVGGRFIIESVRGVGTAVCADIPYLANFEEIQE